MKHIITLIFLIGSVNVFANSYDIELCEQYGRDIAASSNNGQEEFLSALELRIKQGTWNLTAKECNQKIEEARIEFNVEMTELFDNG